MFPRCGIIGGMPNKPAPPTYIEHLLSELAAFEASYLAVTESSEIRKRKLSGGGVVVMTNAPFAWVASTAEVEGQRMDLLRRLRDWAPRFRLLFPHPTPGVRRRVEDSIGLLEDWLSRGTRAKHPAPRDIPAAVTRAAASVATLRELLALLPTDEWRVRLVVDTNILLDDPDLSIYKDAIGLRYMVHLLPVVLREVDDKKRDRNPDLRDAAKKADRRLKGLRDNGDVRVGARVAGDVYAVFEHIEPKGENLPNWLDLDVPDDRLVASSLLLQSQHPGSLLYVATNDLNLQTKLAAVGLPFIQAP